MVDGLASGTGEERRDEIAGAASTRLSRREAEHSNTYAGGAQSHLHGRTVSADQPTSRSSGWGSGDRRQGCIGSGGGDGS